MLEFKNMLSVIVPTFNEINSNYIQKIFPRLAKLSHQIEVIVVDSYSTDGTYEFTKEFDFKVLQIETSSRAVRLNAGIKEAKGDLILLHHPRSVIEEKGIEFLAKNQEFQWGAFTHKFDITHPLLIFTSWYSNYVRGRRGVFYLDHCIFAKKDLLIQIGLIPEVDIFEDTELSLALKKKASPKLLNFTSTTSAIRFTKNGLFTQSYKNQILKLRYYFDFDHRKMNQEYETNLNLNTNYKKDKNGN